MGPDAFPEIHLRPFAPALPSSVRQPLQACVCFYSFHTSLTAYSFFTSIAFLPTTSHPPTYPPNAEPLDVGIQFVLYVSFLLRFRFISCWLLLINSQDMHWEEGGGERRASEGDGEIKTPLIRQWVTPAIIYHLDSSAEAPCSLPWQPVPWWLIPCQCGIAAGNRAHELTVPATSF